jgi:hypothetical protein
MRIQTIAPMPTPIMPHSEHSPALFLEKLPRAKSRRTRDRAQGAEQRDDRDEGPGGEAVPTMIDPVATEAPGWSVRLLRCDCSDDCQAAARSRHPPLWRRHGRCRGRECSTGDRAAARHAGSAAGDRRAYSSTARR